MELGFSSTVIDVSIETERIFCSLRETCHLKSTERNLNTVAENISSEAVLEDPNYYSNREPIFRKRFVHLDAESGRTTSMVEHIYQSGVSGIPIVVKRSRRINDTKVNVTRLRSLGNSQVLK